MILVSRHNRENSKLCLFHSYSGKEKKKKHSAWHDILIHSKEIIQKIQLMSSKLLWGFTLGLVTGLLLAPDKGSETRARIQRKANDLKDKFDDFVDSVSERFESFREEAEAKAQNAKKEAKSFAGDAQNGVL